MRSVTDTDGRLWTCIEDHTGGVGAVTPGEWLGPGRFCVLAKTDEGDSVTLLGVRDTFDDWPDADKLAAIHKALAKQKKP